MYIEKSQAAKCRKMPKMSPATDYQSNRVECKLSLTFGFRN